jgi:DCN1-like protein 1/2
VNRSESQAIALLQATGWALEAAADIFFNGGMEGDEPDVDEAKVMGLFDKYKEADEDTIQVSGVVQFCEDLGVDPTDSIMLLISWQMRAANMCVFTREEWLRGFTAMGCESIDQLKEQFDELRALIEDEGAFKDYYRFCFDFAKEPGFGVRTLRIEVAKQMWGLTLESRFGHMPTWFEFLESQSVKVITKVCARGLACPVGSQSSLAVARLLSRARART